MPSITAMIGAGAVALHRLHDLLLPHHEQVEVAAVAAGGRRQPHGVDEIRALLERLDGQAGARERRAEADAHRGLAGAAVRRGDDYSGQVHGALILARARMAGPSGELAGGGCS